jgi:hypothetical protein
MGLIPSVKLHALYESMVPTGVTIMLELGCGEPAKPRLLYPLVWIPCCGIGCYLISDLESWVTCRDR